MTSTHVVRDDRRTIAFKPNGRGKGINAFHAMIPDGLLICVPAREQHGKSDEKKTDAGEDDEVVHFSTPLCTDRMSVFERKTIQSHISVSGFRTLSARFSPFVRSAAA
jgi:hypothetical protein